MESIRTHLTRSRHLVALALATLVLVAAFPAPALAGPADGWESISATLYDLQVGMAPTLVISALLPEGTTLPHEAALAIPKDSEISWAGELLGMGGDDPVVEFTIEEFDTYDLVNFTLTQSPAAQLELTLPEGSVAAAEGGLSISLAWTSGGTAERARVAIASPLAYHMENVTPSPTVEVRESDVLYWVETVPVAAGQQLTIAGLLLDGPAPEIAAAQAEATATAQPTATAEPLPVSEEPVPAQGSSNLTWVIIGSLVVLIAIILVIIVRKVREQDAAE